MSRPLVALVLLIGALATAWGALAMLGDWARVEERVVRPLELRAGALEVFTDSGDLEVVASTGPPRLEASTSRGLFGRVGVRVDTDAAGRVSVDAACTGALDLGCSSSLRLLVPPGASVRLGTGSGQLTVRGVRGGVAAESGSGDILLGQVGGPVVSASTGSGGITGFGVGAADRLRAEAGSGDVVMSMGRAPAETWVDTGSGEVDLTLPDVPYRVEAETGSGERRVEVDTDGEAARRLRVRTGSGDLIVRPRR